MSAIQHTAAPYLGGNDHPAHEDHHDAGSTTLVGTHGLHITSGLIWILVLSAMLLRDGLTERNRTRVMCLSLFWHFLDIIWIGVFTLVYLLGVL